MNGSSLSENLRIYGLKLHEDINISNAVNVLRVPGGWIYTIAWSGIDHKVFVPFSDEFMTQSQKLSPNPSIPG